LAGIINNTFGLRQPRKTTPPAEVTLRAAFLGKRLRFRKGLFLASAMLYNTTKTPRLPNYPAAASRLSARSAMIVQTAVPEPP